MDFLSGKQAHQSFTDSAFAKDDANKKLKEFKSHLNVKTLGPLQNVNEYDRKNVEKLPVGKFYVRNDKKDPHLFHIVARIKATGTSDDVFSLPFEWTVRGIKELNQGVKELKATKTFDNVEDLILNYAKQTAGQALPILISHRLGHLYDGSIDDRTAISRLETSDKPLPVFICIPASNQHYSHFKLLILSNKDESVKKFEYQYDATKDGFVLSSNPLNSPVFKNTDDLLKHHHLDEKHVLKKKIVP